MRIQHYLSLTLLGMILIACQNQQSLSQYKAGDPQGLKPQGTVYIGEGLYYDYAEISNLSWKEYTYWLANKYGEESEAYLSALPDTSVWLEMDDSMHPFSKYYWQEGSFKHYPVVGVSQEQARNYSQWRSDRVMEQILIKKGYLDPEEQDSNQIFSIERLIAGKIKLKKQLPAEFAVPHYRLPSLEEWRSAKAFNDSIVHSDASRDEKMLDDYQERAPLIFDIGNSKLNGGVSPYVVLPADFPDLKRKAPLLYQLQGNANEWADEEKICLGGSYLKSMNWLSLNDFQEVQVEAAASIGFRNVCEWKKVELKSF